MNVTEAKLKEMLGEAHIKIALLAEENDLLRQAVTQLKSENERLKPPAAMASVSGMEELKVTTPIGENNGP